MRTITRICACIASFVPAAAALAQQDCEDTATAWHANQLGFYPDHSLTAILATGSPVPAAWEMLDDRDEVVVRGRSRVFGDDPLSGQHVHRITIDTRGMSGSGYRLRSACATSHPFAIGEDIYAGLAYDALAYFYQNRSGVEIEEAHTGSALLARPAGHPGDVAGCRSGEDQFGNVWPGCEYTLDVTGGWYDAGDHGKYVVNGGIAVWTLLNTWERQQVLGESDLFADGHATLPESGNGVSDLLDEARYEIEFLLRMQAPEDTVATVPVGIRHSGPDLTFSDIDASGMAHHKVADIEWAPFPMPPHTNRQKRVLHPVSTAATLNLAAVAAQCARIWEEIDEDLASRCLHAAERAWTAARRNPEVFFIATFSGSGMYGDAELGDEFFWAAAELFITTGRAEFASALRQSPLLGAPIESGAGWQDVAPLGFISLALLPNGLPDGRIDAIREQLLAAATGFVEAQDSTGYLIPYDSANYVWGSNSVLLNRAMLLALAYDFTGQVKFRDAVVNVMDYLLGRNPLAVSYVSGYGERSMQHPHHRHWAPSFDAGLPRPPAGALSGGPNNTAMADPVAQQLRGKCAPQACWRDDPEAYALNEVAINWNAPLVWVAAWLATRQVPATIDPGSAAAVSRRTLRR